MTVLAARKQHSPQQEVMPAGQLEPAEPAYYISRAPGAQLSSAQQVPSEPVAWKAPVVYRGERMTGIRHLYARGMTRQPLSPLGTGPDIGIGVWSSDFQPDLMGPVHDAGFNDALYQAGYPGFNLGLSFKVQALPTQTTGPGKNIRMRTPDVVIRIQQIATGKNQVQVTG